MIGKCNVGAADEGKAVNRIMNFRKAVFFLCTAIAMMMLVACEGNETGKDNKPVKEQWAYLEDEGTPCLKLYEDGSAAFKTEKSGATAKLTQYKKYEFTDEVLKLTAEDGSVTEMKYYDTDTGKRYVYQKITLDYYSGDDSSTLIGAWTCDNEWSFQFSDKGTFLEDGLWAGYFIPNGEGSLRLIYDNQVFSDIILYYSLENGKLILDYPFGMVKMQ